MPKRSTAKIPENASVLANLLVSCLADLEGKMTEAKAMVSGVSLIMDGTHFPKETPAGIGRAWGAATMVSAEAEKLTTEAEEMTRTALRMAYELRSAAPAPATEPTAAPATDLDLVATTLFCQSRALGLLVRALDGATLSDKDRDIFSFTLDGAIEAIERSALLLSFDTAKGAAA